jgi:hypothetical protein
MNSSSSTIGVLTILACRLLGVAISFTLLGFRVPFISKQGIQQANTPSNAQIDIDRSERNTRK